MIKAIFWDNDGILVDTERLYFQATQQVLAEIGVDFAEAMYIDLFLNKAQGAWHLALEKGLSEGDIPRLKERRNAVYSQFLREQDLLINGVTETLEQFHGNFAMGIVTSSRRDHFDIIHQSTGILPYFDFVITHDDFTKTKPDPEPYLMALQKTGLAPEECIVVEDSARGFTAASRAGLSCYVIPTALTQGGNFAGARKVLGSIRELVSELL